MSPPPVRLPVEQPPDDLSDQSLWNYLAKLGLGFAVVVTGGAATVLACGYLALWYLANS